MREHRQQGRERGTMLIIVAFVAAAIAALAALSAGRVVAETKRQRSSEDESRAYNQAYAQLHMAMNAVNNSLYNANNQNLVLQAALSLSDTEMAEEIHDKDVLIERLGDQGGAYRASGNSAQDKHLDISWLVEADDFNDDGVADIEHGVIPGTSVRVYRGRDYIKRLQKLKGETVDPNVDLLGNSDSYYVLEAAGRSGGTVRLVSALVRENEPFSSFVFFQNQHTLGVSGAPRGLIHANADLAFYFSNGKYVDPVSAVNGFSYTAGATEENTIIQDGNQNATKIDLESVDFAELKGEADFVGDDGLDAEIRTRNNGQLRIRQYTPPRYEEVTEEYSYTPIIGYEDSTWEMVPTWVDKEGWVDVPEMQDVIEMQDVTVTVPDYDYVDIYHEPEPIWEEQPTGNTIIVDVWTYLTPDDPDYPGGGGAVGGDADDGDDGGDWFLIPTPVPEMEWVITGHTDGWWEYNVWQQVGSHQETTQVPVVIGQEPTGNTVQEWQTWQELEDVLTEIPGGPIHGETVTWEETFMKHFPPEYVSTDYVYAHETAKTVYIDGRVTKLYGSSGRMRGRATIVANEKVRITGDIRYVDSAGRYAMKNGTDPYRIYERNEDYAGNSTLGIIARDDILFTRNMRWRSELNATMMSVKGRVGLEGFHVNDEGEILKVWRSNGGEDTNFHEVYTADAEEGTPEYEAYWREKAYQKTGYKARSFTKDSLRRIGGTISNSRIFETYIEPNNNGDAVVKAGFRKGSMKFDLNLLFNPPPNFVEVPRPVLVYYAPIFLVRNHDS